MTDRQTDKQAELQFSDDVSFALPQQAVANGTLPVIAEANKTENWPIDQAEIMNELIEQREFKKRSTDYRGLTTTTLPKMLFSREFRQRIIQQKDAKPGENQEFDMRATQTKFSSKQNYG